MFKKILISVVIVLAIIVGIFIWFFNNQTIEVTVIKEAYNSLSEAETIDSIYPMVYVNQKKSFITDINKINKCYIHSKDNENSYQMLVNTIKLVDTVEIDSDVFYVYCYELTFKGVFSDNIEIKEAFLEIDYTNSKTINLFIGSVSCYKYSKASNSNLDVVGVKGITAKVDNKKILSGIVLKLASNDNFTINKITCLDLNACCQEYILCDYDSINSLTKLTDITNKEYHYNNYTETTFNLEVDKEVEMLLLLGYLDSYEIGSMGLKIDYTVDGVSKTKYLEPFIFFVNNERTVKLSELTFYQYEYN